MDIVNLITRLTRAVNELFITELLIPFSQHCIISTGRDTELTFSKEEAK